MNVIKCDVCRHALTAVNVRSGQFRRIEFQTALGLPLYNIVICPNCMERALSIIYGPRRENDADHAGEGATPAAGDAGNCIPV